MKRFNTITLLLLINITLFSQGGVKCINTNGTSSYINIGNRFKYTSAFTFEAWVYSSNWNVTTNRTIVSCYENGGYRISINDATAPSPYNTGYLNALIYNGSAQYVSYALSNLNPGWHHIAMSYSGSELDLFVDGILRTSKVVSGAIVYNASNSILAGAEAGTGSTPAGAYWSGSIDEIRIWNTAVSINNIEDWMHRPLTSSHPDVTSLYGYYKCDEGTGTTLSDKAPSIGGNLTSDNISVSNGTWATSYIPLSTVGSNPEAIWQTLKTTASESSQGFWFKSSSTLASTQMVVYANNGLTGTSTADLPSTANIRSARIWQSDRSGTFKVNFIFDLSDTGLSSMYVNGLAAGQYKLLYRSATTGAFSLAASGSAVTGNQVTFSSVSVKDGYYCIGRAYLVPTVTTTATSGITSTSAVSGGNVTLDGGSAVTAKGICWNTTGTPTIANSKTTDGSGTGSYTSNITGLTALTVYYVRAYATNAKGTSYGVQQTFSSIGSSAGQAYNVTSTINSLSSVTFNWVRGNAAKCIAFITEDDKGTAAIQDNKIYTASAVYGAGTVISNTKWYCVYNGTGSTVTVTGLNYGTTYRLQVCEYNVVAGKEKYNISTAASNPINTIMPAGVTWNGTSWDYGTPGPSMDVIITGNYKVGSNDGGSDLTCRNLTINTGDTMFVQPGKSLTVTGTATVTGNLIIESNASGDGSFIDNGSVSGIVTVQRYLTPNQWHNISAPISDATAGLLTRFYIKPYDEATDTYGAYIKNIDTAITVAGGYAVWAKTLQQTVSYTGNVNTGTIVTNTLQHQKQGYNLIGNPYPSCIDWDAPSIDKSNISGTIWIWNGTQYSTYTSGIGGTNGGSRYISSGQGFFVQTLSQGQTLTFNNTMRVHNSVTLLKEAVAEQNILRVRVTDSYHNDECIIAFRESGSNGYDQHFDAKKMFGSADIAQIYSVSDTQNLAVNVLNSNNLIDSILLQIVAPYTGKFDLIFSSSLKNNYSLFDKKNNETNDIGSALKYSAILSAGDQSDRFWLVLKNEAIADTTVVTGDTTGSTTVTDARQKVIVTVRNQDAFVTGLDNTVNTAVSVFDLNGKLIRNQSCNGCVDTELLSLPQGAYILRVINGDNIVVKKILIF